VCACVHVCMCACVHVHVHVRMCICMCVMFYVDGMHAAASVLSRPPHYSIPRSLPAASVLLQAAHLVSILPRAIAFKGLSQRARGGAREGRGAAAASEDS
jgi:hypothetical protein